MTDLTTLGIAEAGRLMARGEITSVALTEAFLKRIEAVDSKVHSYITVTADVARLAAQQADMEMRGGFWRGPLHGIPVALKDIYETAGIRTTGHSHLKADYVPSIDAETVRRLKAGGAVLLGKLGTHEFANGAMTADQPFPAVLNPWTLKHQPGGSSSGSGAAVAAALCMGAMGSDTGGSIRNPAGYCGVAGIKPTYGLVSRCGIFPLAFSLDTAGPMAWTVEDCALMLDVLAGHDPNDQASAKVAKVDYGAAAQRPIKGMRIALARSWYERDDASITPETKKGIDEAVRVFKDLGAIVEDVVFPDLWGYHVCGRIIISVEAHAIHRRDIIERPEKFGYTTRRRFQIGAFFSAEQYLSALRLRRQLHQETRAAMRGYDLVMMASQWGPPEPADEAPAIFHFLSKPSLTMPFNVTGQPALALCCGYGSDGLPLSIQLGGRAFDEASVFAAGAAYERATGWRSRRPAL
ncbi:aspartyl-tRNA(Asn)/glutamyl-tRNA(Gln) amidotransferase subunit A [Enhydrobacter aerosaccus]|uniref:Indoleacetamide hydrolase n=1 Tax=Enhydrobacter aerosaccus TaxID=225324 RepID=A0A1T4QID0_9HYPH|nr:Asp-tRNA(Asn)/Glu-tRNA(Gln) amidotransferase GatCAB subunit A [Enhydrobacter aerosaccus]SKA03550.1 aspartyl-tRNA(Asn)/glutamyl-tRNA(Gln) amidotransferase subunit A [Enhydrobacter aerosaccus]